MARERHSDEGCLMLLCEIEMQLAFGSAVSSMCRAVGVSN